MGAQDSAGDDLPPTRAEPLAEESAMLHKKDDSSTQPPQGGAKCLEGEGKGKEKKATLLFFPQESQDPGAITTTRYVAFSSPGLVIALFKQGANSRWGTRFRSWIE